MVVKKSSKNQNHRRVWKWLISALAVFVLIVLVVFVWFRLSPWPGAMIIRFVFEQNGAKTTAALEKHAPEDVATISDQQYKSGDDAAKLDVYFPEATPQGEKLPVIIWTHGGAWISGSKTDAAPYFKLLAKKGYAVIAPNYSLAPEKTYPTPIYQLNVAYKYIMDNADRFHADTNKIILAGDSAGSQLSAQMAALITNPDYAKEVGVTPNFKPEQLKGMVLTCGIYKMEQLAHPSPNLSKIIGWGDSVVVWAYSGTRDFSDSVIRQMSPYYFVTEDFPPAFITGGNADPLTDVQSKPFAEKLQSLNVPVSTLFYPKNHEPRLPHEYQFNLDNPDGQKAFDRINAFISQRTN